MPSKCSVPNCRGNYKNEEYISIFSFPRKEPLRSLWLKRIGREDFQPTVHSKVCERHFSPSDVLREASGFDENLGKFITAKLAVPKLREGAIPSIFIDHCPTVRRKGRVKKVKVQKAEEEVETSEESTVCERHFRPSDVIKETSFFDRKSNSRVTVVTKASLRKGALPLPPSTSSNRDSKPAVKRRRLQKMINDLKMPVDSDIEKDPTVILKHYEIADETDEIEMIEKIDFSNLTELEENLHLFDLSDFWNIATGKNSLAFIHIKWTHAPKIHLSVVVDENLSVSVFKGDVEIKATKTFSFPKRVRNIIELKMILNETKEDIVSEFETSRKLQIVKELLDSLKGNLKNHKVTLNFLREQTSLLTDSQKLYSSDTLIFATLLFSIAPHAYRFLIQCENIILPELDIIKNLFIPLQTSVNKEISPIKFLKHAKGRFGNLKDSDKNVVLQIGEVYLKPFLENEGNIAGMSMEVDDAATSVYVFMITSLCSSYKDTVHLLPVQSLRVKEVHDVLKEVVIGLEYIGFRVIAVVTDDSSESKQVLSFFSEPPLFNSIVYKHPFDSLRPLFHLISYAHLLKNIRNDWISLNNHGECIFYPYIGDETDNHSIKIASFPALKTLHDVESSSHLKYFSCLSSNAVSAKNIEKHNIESVLEIFKNVISDRLILYGEDHELPHYQDTADFIKLISTWWSIVNPDSPYEKRDNQTSGSLSTSEKSYDFLQMFLDWLDSWSNIECDSGITAKTHSELHLSTYALIELTAYCKNELGMSFILPGNIQMDYGMTRFGFFRTPSSLEFFQKKQWPKIEPELKTMDTLLLSLIDNNDVNLTALIEKETVNLTETIDRVNTFIPMIITDEDIASNETNIPVLLFLAGYCVRSVLKELDCEHCKSHFSTNEFLELHPSVSEKGIDEDLLKYPSRVAMNIVILSFTVLSKLCKEHASEFWTQANRSSLAYNLTINVLESTGHGLYRYCSSGHSLMQAVKMIVKSVVYNVLDSYDKGYNS